MSLAAVLYLQKLQLVLHAPLLPMLDQQDQQHQQHQQDLEATGRRPYRAVHGLRTVCNHSPLESRPLEGRPADETHLGQVRAAALTPLSLQPATGGRTGAAQRLQNSPFIRTTT